MSAEEQDYTAIQAILSTAVPHIAEQQGRSFSRSIVVANGTQGGDIKVSASSVTVHPRFATSGDTVEMCCAVIKACDAFDRRLSDEEEKRKKEVEDSLRSALRRARKRLDLHHFHSILDEEIK